MLELDKIQFPAFYQKLSISVLHLKLCSKGNSDDLIQEREPQFLKPQ